MKIKTKTYNLNPEYRWRAARSVAIRGLRSKHTPLRVCKMATCVFRLHRGAVPSSERS